MEIHLEISQEKLLNQEYQTSKFMNLAYIKRIIKINTQYEKVCEKHLLFFECCNVFLQKLFLPPHHSSHPHSRRTDKLFHQPVKGSH